MKHAVRHLHFVASAATPPKRVMGMRKAGA